MRALNKRAWLWIPLLLIGALLGKACGSGQSVATDIPVTVTPTPSAAVIRVNVPTDSAAPTRVVSRAISQLSVTPPPSSTVDAEEQTLTLSPKAQDVGWWTSGQVRGYLGDSFLYAGAADGQIFLSAFRLDLSQIPRGVHVREATLEMTGLRADRLASDAVGQWSVQILAPDALDELGRATFQEIYNAPAEITLFPLLSVADLAGGRTNRWQLDSSVRLRLSLQRAVGQAEIWVRILGPASGDGTLFAWDSGFGPASAGNGPVLHLDLAPAPATPLPPQPTGTPVVVTLTPTPANIFTQAAEVYRATVIAATIGTFTPTPANQATPTPTDALAANLSTAQAIAKRDGLLPVVEFTATPANGATAEALAQYATAVARTTGTFTPVPTEVVTPFIVTPTPVPENVLTAAARVASPVVLSTPLPYNAVVATTTPPPIVVTSTPMPANEATADAMAQYATAVALTTGTATPTPVTMVTATSLPFALVPLVPLVQYLDDLAPTPTSAPPTPLPSTMPNELVGNILFISTRDGGGLFMLNPTDGRLARITQDWPYALARPAESRAPDGKTVVVQNDNRRLPQIYIDDPQYNVLRQLTTTTGWSYDPAWSPTGEWIAFVSDETGNDEIFLIRPDGSEMQQLTHNDWQWDKHPSWSPDGSQIVFWSNRDLGRAQIWIMNSDGSNQRRLLSSPFEDMNPIWVK